MYCEDEAGNQAWEYLNLVVDRIYPVLNVDSPNEYDHFSTPPIVQITKNDTNTLSQWYTVNDIPFNYSFLGNSFTIEEWGSQSDGNITICVYVEDLAKNRVNSPIILFKSLRMILIP